MLGGRGTLGRSMGRVGRRRAGVPWAHGSRQVGHVLLLAAGQEQEAQDQTAFENFAAGKMAG